MNQSQKHSDSTIATWFSDVLRSEADAIEVASNRIGEEIAAVVRTLQQCRGRVVVTGMGKMGCIARKAAGTFSSTGTPAIFLDPADALHGGLGVVSENDVVLAISNSGETKEVVELLPYFARHKLPIISITGNPNSALARQSQHIIDASVKMEADPDSIAPTNSSSVALACCDGLAVSLMKLRGFSKEQFAIFHPGGHLGRKLLILIRELMHSGDRIPLVTERATLAEAIRMISEKQMGTVVVVKEDGLLSGVLTDGDVRRIFESTANEQSNPLTDLVTNHMTRHPASIGIELLAAEALSMMEEKQITVLPVVDDKLQVQGIIHMHDLIRSGLA